ncbi:glycosyltransferase [Clostridium cadaveris]
MKKTVIYIGNFSFPLGNAAGKRVYANGKILKELGYEPIFIGMSNEVDKFRTLVNTKKKYEGFIYYNFPYPNKSLDWINYKKTFASLLEFLRETKIIDDLGLVIYYGSPTLSFFNTRLIRFCKKQNIKVVTDCVDWLTVKTNNPLFNIIKWADNSYQKAYANKKADGVIAISKYLSNYYKKNGCKTVIIPPLSPINYGFVESSRINQDIKIITYAGLPFRKGQQVKDCNLLKDRIDKTISLLYEAKKEGCKFLFNIYGFTREEYLVAIPKQKLYLDELGDSIQFHGPKPNEVVVEAVKKSDFTILIRDVNRDTMAGFPTKISESISCGTPVITTRTSDLDSYIIEGNNGFFLDMEDEEFNIKKIKEILNKDLKEIYKIKVYCNQNKVFYFKAFKTRFSEFLNKLKV